jgi:hypothetical protein
LPYELYEKLQEKIEDELYLFNNQKALSKGAYDEFLDTENVVEDLTTLIDIELKAVENKLAKHLALK